MTDTPDASSALSVHQATPTTMQEKRLLDNLMQFDFENRRAQVRKLFGALALEITDHHSNNSVEQFHVIDVLLEKILIEEIPDDPPNSDFNWVVSILMAISPIVGIINPPLSSGLEMQFWQVAMTIVLCMIFFDRSRVYKLARGKKRKSKDTVIRNILKKLKE